MNKYIIKKIDDMNIEEVLEIYTNNAEYFDLCKTDVVNLKTIEDDLGNIPPGIDLGQKQFILYTDENIGIGVVDLILGFPESDIFYIGLLLVDGNNHNLGYGTKIYNSIEEEMKILGYKRGRLGVMENNFKAINFWKKMGYSHIKTTETTIGSGINCIVHIMEKSICL